jgi:hypothetical protein
VGDQEAQGGSGMLKYCPNCKHKIHFPDVIFDEPFACESCGSILKPEINEPGNDFNLEIFEVNDLHINPVEWTADGYPVFTDAGQFKKWEEQNRKKLLDEINEVLDARAVELAALAVESRETFIVEEIKRLAEQIESIEVNITEEYKVLNSEFERFKKLFKDHLENYR